MSSRSESHSSKGQRSPSPPKQSTKLFITNLDGKADVKEMEAELTKHFQKHGEVLSLTVKQYCFAFAEMKDHDAASECVKNFDQSSLGGKQIKVEFQDDTKRRKDSNVGCYNCGKKGHFARECRAPKSDERGYGRRDRSRSRSRSKSDDYRRHKHKKRRSYSSERDRSYDRDKKRRRDSRERDDKKKKKHRRRSESD